MRRTSQSLLGLLAMSLALGCSASPSNPLTQPAPSRPILSPPQGESLSVHGSKFIDQNFNGIQDSGEPTLANWPVHLYRLLDSDRVDWQSPLASTLTDSSGKFTFHNLAPGTYLVASAATSGGSAYEQGNLPEGSRIERVRIRTLRGMDPSSSPPANLEPMAYRLDLTQGPIDELRFVNRYAFRMPGGGMGSGSGDSSGSQSGPLGTIFTLLEADVLDGFVYGQSSVNDHSFLLHAEMLQGANDISVIGQGYNANRLPIGNPETFTTFGDNPNLAYNARNDSYLATWHTHTLPTRIFTQRVTAQGEALDQPKLVSEVAGGMEYPFLAYNSKQNQFLIVWDDSRNEAFSEPNIFGRILSEDGTPLGNDIPISLLTLGQHRPVALYNSQDNEYLVIWNDFRTGTWTIFGQRIDAAGNLLGLEIPIATGHDTGEPMGCYNPVSNEYLIVWEDERNLTTSGSDLFAQRVGGDGTLRGGNITVSDAFGNQFLPHVAHNPTTNQYVVVWEDDRNFVETLQDIIDQANRFLIEGLDIYAQRLGATGNLVGGNLPIAQGNEDQVEPFIHYDPRSNEFFVTWVVETDLKSRVMGQRFR